MEDLIYAALGMDRSRLLAWSALPDAPVVPDHPHRFSAAARRLVGARRGSDRPAAGHRLARRRAA